MEFLERLYGDAVQLAGRAIDARGGAGRVLTGGSQEPDYGIDEYGRAYVRGAPSGPGGIDSRLVLIVGGLAAIALVVVLAKS